jgi:heme-degrading monooxygenase HmoA
MNARVAFFNIKPGRHEEAVTLFRDLVVPEARKQKGFEGGLLLTNAETGKGISIGLWETEADMIVSEETGFYQQWVAKISDVFVMPPFMEHYEVIIKDV